jgi:transcription elongation factor Elf1
LGSWNRKVNYMATKITALKRAFQAAKQAMGPQRYGANGKIFSCAMCGHDKFNTGQYVGLLMLHTIICAECGHAEFFDKAPPIAKGS